jgi:hypothetical protein
VWGGLGLGLGIAALPALLAWTVNPWFMDAPHAYLLLVSLPLALLGALLGWLSRRLLTRAPRWSFGLCLAVGLGGFVTPPLLGAWPRPDPVSELRLLVFGLDGATFHILDAQRARLPTFERLEREGVRATLLSMEPMFSPLVWTTMATGQPPEVHGIHGFHTSATDCLAPRFWDLMADEGMRVGIYKWLVTYPPDRRTAFMVPAWLAPATETWPEDLAFIKEIELSRRLKRKRIESRRAAPMLLLDGVRHGFRVGTLAEALRFVLQERLGRASAERSLRDAQLLRVRMDRDLFLWALHRHRPEVATFTDYATDALGHHFWRYYEPSRFPGLAPEAVARWGSTLPDTYAQADEILAEMLANASPDLHVVMVSDHGFRAMESSDEGRYFVPTTRRLQERLGAALGQVEVSRMGHKIVVSVRRGGEEALLRLEEQLQSLRDDASGEPFYRWERVPDSDFALGLTLRDEEVPAERLVRGTVGGEPLSDYVSRTEAYSGEHAREGVFLAMGPGIARAARLPALELVDVAPTLLSMVGLAGSKDMPGRVPDGLWSEPPALPPEPATFMDRVSGRRLLSGQDGVNEEQLRVLGYVE